ncbi:GLI zinc finger 1 [Entomophthora muscae]|uniref:GLI zinc finger 1 n=1 Tax=Entomophthora muscae TaxID=34485 RepID=A0ACC2TRF5_9FUNG|nr:GLI zinc finger 1 [Entomophthora muscae]
MHSHTNQRPFRCSAPGCSKAYNDPKTLREHKRTHGEKTFLCTVPACSKSFHRKTHLKQHLRTHNREEAAGPFMEVEEQDSSSTMSAPVFSHRSLLNNSTDSHFQVRRSTNPQ